MEQNFSFENLLLQIITLNSIKNKNIIKNVHSNKLTPVFIQISKNMFSFFKLARVKYKNHLQEEKKRKITSEKESRKAVNNEEIKSVRITTTRKEKKWCLRKKLSMQWRNL